MGILGSKAAIKYLGKKKTEADRLTQAFNEKSPVEGIAWRDWVEDTGEFTGWGLDSDSGGFFTVGLFKIKTGYVKEILPENIRFKE